MPKWLSWNECKFEAQELLVNFQCLLDHMLSWEILFDLLFVNTIELFLKDVGVEAFIPRIQNSICIACLFSLEILNSLELLTTSLLKLCDQ